MRNLCVFCGSRKGNNPEYEKTTRELGQSMVTHGIRLIYGGGSIGLMGILADTILSLKGQVTGVIPKFLYDLELGHHGLTEMIIVESMHQRKEKMAEISDGFLALPGGFGTLDELAEILTWIQLKLIRKPVGLLNINGFFNPFIHQLDLMVKESFLSIQNREILHISDFPDKIIGMLRDGSLEMNSRLPGFDKRLL